MSRKLLAAAIALHLAVGPGFAGPKAFLEKLDAAMKNYGNNIVAEGDANLATMKDVWDKVKHGKFKELPQSVHNGMVNYGTSMQKTGDDALTDSKAMLKELLNVRTYIPEFILKAWDALVGKLSELKARFLARCENPWADDPPAGGGGGASDSEPAPAADSAPAGDTAPATTPAAGDGSLPGDAAAGGDVPAAGGDAPVPDAGAAQASSVRGKVLSASDLTATFDDYAGLVATTTELGGLAQKSKADGKAKVTAAVNHQGQEVRRMGSRLSVRLARNPAAAERFIAHVERMDRTKARTAFAAVVAETSQRLNTAAMRSGAPARTKDVAKKMAALRTKLRK